jgi:hypothetical protein
MNRLAVDQIAQSLAQRVTAGASTAQIAQAVAQVCRDIDTALTPIIGPRGVGALSTRCLHLAGRTYPWLTSAPAGDIHISAVSTLQARLAQRSNDEAAAAGLLFLQTFDALLISLIGASLTERLLDPVWATFLNAPPALDTPS